VKKTNSFPTIADSIAIIGMRGRFPGADNVQELWNNLTNGVESISTFSEVELKAAGVDPAYLNVPGYVNRGCVLKDVDLFDAGFFGYSARDAETIDPQQRVFLECAWECLEQAGCDPDSYPGMIGVFAGSDQSSYFYQICSSVDMSAYGYSGMMSIGNEKDYLATQVSYKLNLRGPSMAIQTSCSTSLVAVCMACQSLAHGYCDMALTGGVGIGVPQKRGYWYQPGGIVSPDGHCRPFDASGQGTVVGNGIGMVLLKRLAEAVADGDHIHAVIKGFAINNDGAAKVGYTAPSVEGQAQVIRMAQSMAGVEPETIGYVETHGTATALGDPIEVAALTKAFRARTNKRQFCAIGSLKSNVGHLSSAAGIAGLIKGILVVENGQIPKSLHYEQPNPQIDFEKSPFFVASKLTEWQTQGHPRRAGVSSFGVGGTNAHIVLEEAPPIASDPAASEKQIMVLSARTAPALERVTDNMVNYLENLESLKNSEKSSDVNLADVAFTCQVGRKAFSHRRAIVFDRANRADLIATLKTRDPLRVATAQTEIRDRAVVFMFSGQGTQYVNMGRELYQTEKTFRENVDACCDILKGELNFDLRELLYPAHDEEQVEAAERLKQTAITQPALFTIEYSLARLWSEWGLTPKAMLGHSIGEYVAACIAGVMDLPEALSVVAMRGRLMDSMPGGSMLAVPLPEAALQSFLSPAISLAAVNAPSICVLSGTAPAIDAIEKDLVEQGLPCRRLHTSHAFHSSMMDPVITQFVERLSRVNLKPPQIPYLSNLTGSWITPELATNPGYWGSHMRQTVRFADNLRELMVFPDLALIEVGPGQTLSILAKQQGSRANSQLFVPSMRSAQEPDSNSDSAFLRNSVGQLWLGGVRIDWRGFHAHEKRRVVSLPTYPFEHQRFWLGPLDHTEAPESQPLAAQAAQNMQAAQAAQDSMLGFTMPVQPTVSSATATNFDDWFFVPNWKRVVSSAKPLADAADDTEAANEAWLVFEDSSGLGAAITQHLQSIKRRVNTVARGDSFGKLDEGYQLRDGEKSDYEAMIKDLIERKQYPSRILHIWSAEPSAELSAKPSADATIQLFDEAQHRSFYSVTFLAQALAKSGKASPVQIGVVADSLHAVLEDENLRSSEATVLGACKVISQEYPNLRCRLIDVVAAQAQDKLAECVVRELSVERFSPVVAYRNGRRWIQEYEQIRLDEREKPAALRDGAVYLITGGLGNIGLILAEAIAREVKAKLVLVGRSSFPERARWDELTSTHATDQTTARIRKLKAIEEMGAEIMVAQADVANIEQMRAVVASVKEKWGEIHGVIHGAANLSPDAFRSLRETDHATSGGHFRSKAHGLLILEEVLRDEPLDFYVLLSSISAVLGGLDLAAYSASNAYLDAEAQRQNRHGSTNSTNWISINWDAWDFSTGKTQPDAISATQGQEAFRRILAAPFKQTVVSAGPLAARLDKWVYFESAETASPKQHGQYGQPVSGNRLTSSNGSAATAATADHVRPELSTQFVAPRSETEKTVAGVWEHLLGIKPIGIYDKFFELGGHSLLAIQLLSQLREIYAMDIPVQRIFEAPTIVQLAESIEHDRESAGTTTAEVEALEANGNGDGNLEEMLSLVEGLSESELDALLSEAEAIQEGKESHG